MTGPIECVRNKGYAKITHILVNAINLCCEAEL